MTFHIVTLFPEAFASYLGSSILKRAQEAGHISVRLYDIRDYTHNKWRKADDRPYGGGPGMVLYAEPIIRAVEGIKRDAGTKVKTIILSPDGDQFTNTKAKALSRKHTDVILVCGHYEGIDARVQKALKAEELSVGPYVLTGGELPALVVVDAVARQIEGVLGDAESLEESRVSSSEVYTRPDLFEYAGRKYRVPKVLLSGDHKKIEAWKKAGKKSKVVDK